MVNVQLNPPPGIGSCHVTPFPSATLHGHTNGYVIADTRRERHYLPFAAETRYQARSSYHR